MVRVLNRFRGRELALGACLLAAATVTACAGKALNVGSEDPTGAGGEGGSGGSAISGNPGVSGGPGRAGGSGASVGGRRNGTGGSVSGSAAGSGGADGIPPTPTLSPEDLATIQWPADTTCTDAPDSPKVGTWKGHWPESLAGGATDAEVVVHITGLTPEGVPCGTVTIGTGPALPPVTDADAIYPPSQGAGGGGLILTGAAVTQPWPGYEYRMLNVTSTESRLAFSITYQEILRPWCQLQEPAEGSLSCLPQWSSANASNGVCNIAGPGVPSMEVPCFKVQYCSTSTCFCYDGSCDVSISGQQAAFELHWDGPALEGSVNQGLLLFLDPVP